MSEARACTCKNPKPRTAGAGGAVCVECHGEIRAKKMGEQPAENDILPASRKSSRAMTEVERQEWRDLNRRVRMYEEAFGVRYSRD
jgi:hypothetical protein